MNTNNVNSSTNSQNNFGSSGQTNSSNNTALPNNINSNSNTYQSQQPIIINKPSIQQPTNINYNNNTINQLSPQNTNTITQNQLNTTPLTQPTTINNQNVNYNPYTQNYQGQVNSQTSYIQSQSAIPNMNNMANGIQDQSTISNNQENTPLRNFARKFCVVLICVGIIITGLAIYLLFDNNNKYKTYISSPADLVDFDTISKNGLTYYKGNYKYKVNKKEYFYTPNTLSREKPEKLIQIKYNKEKPEKLYNDNLSKYFLIMLFSGIGLTFISGISTLALKSSKTREIITAQVIEQVNCVGGKRIYFSNLNIADNSSEALTKKYYVYFSNDSKKFAIGNKLNFDIYKYGEAFTTEKYKNISARIIYNFKDEDFTLVSNNKI